MKKTALSAALLVGALGLAGCMGAPEEEVLPRPSLR